MSANDNTKPQPTRAVIYARVSSAKQVEEGHGLESQAMRCREYAERKGYAVVETFFDKAISGSLSERPGVMAMLSYLKHHSTSGEIAVIIDDISCLARDTRVHTDLRLAISLAGGKLESPSITFGDDSDSIFVENVLASASQHQRQKNGEQTKNRMRARAMNGHWVFHAPTGYTYKKVAGHGKLQYPCKTAAGTVRYEEVLRLLSRPHYAGYIEVPHWGVPLRKGHHDGLIDLSTYETIQRRIKGGVRVFSNQDIGEDFPLRGYAVCADCGGPLTAGWSKSKTGKKHPYYFCFNKGCACRGKSIKRDVIKEKFGTLLEGLRPSAQTAGLFKDLFFKAWDDRANRTEEIAKALRDDLRKTEQQIEQLLDRIVEFSTASVIAAYKRRIANLEREKLVIIEKLQANAFPKRGSAEQFELAFRFLENPQELWTSERLDDKKLVLKLTFADRLAYCRNGGFRTPQTTLPFKALEAVRGEKCKMAEGVGFEPTVRFPAHTRSRRAPSTTRPPLQPGKPGLYPGLAIWQVVLCVSVTKPGGERHGGFEIPGWIGAAVRGDGHCLRRDPVANRGTRSAADVARTPLVRLCAGHARDDPEICEHESPPAALGSDSSCAAHPRRRDTYSAGVVSWLAWS